jgi:hypothetical protein
MKTYRRPIRKLRMESLERREVMAANVTATLAPDGLLQIEGTPRDDVIVVSQVNGQISVSGVRGTFAASRVKAVDVVGLEGNDEIRLDSEAWNTQFKYPNPFISVDMLPNELIRVPVLVDGGAGNDTIVGGAAADVLLGGAGNDSVDGNSGDDVIHGGAGDDTIYGRAGNDRIYADEGNDSALGGSGDDTVYADDGNDRVHGEDGNDSIWGGNGDDTLNGGLGDDSLSAEQGRDQVFGDLGHDVLTGGDGDDWLTGGDGDDYLLGNEGNDYLEGNSGNDMLHGAAGNDTLYGGDHNDELHGGTGSDALYGQAGRDRFFDNYFRTREDYNFFTESWTNSQSDAAPSVPRHNQNVTTSTPSPRVTTSTPATTTTPPSTVSPPPTTTTRPSPVVSSTPNTANTNNSTANTSRNQNDAVNAVILALAIQEAATSIPPAPSGPTYGYNQPLYTHVTPQQPAIWNPNTLGGSSVQFGLNNYNLPPVNTSSSWLDPMFSDINAAGGVNFGLSSGY